MSGIKCYNCNKFAGHISKDCPEPRRERKGQQQQQGRALVARAEEDEPALHLARACTLSDDDGPSLLMATVIDLQLHEARADAPTTNASGCPVHIDLLEDRVHLAKEDHRDDTWFLDTGASNHMTGKLSAFAELDHAITGTVKFGDGSVVDIKGRGTILFACADGEHRALTDVYYIPQLRGNIMSLG